MPVSKHYRRDEAVLARPAAPADHQAARDHRLVEEPPAGVGVHRLEVR
jgi:hypothetical protein